MLCPSRKQRHEEEDELYDKQEQLVYQTPKHDVLLVMEIINAKVRNDSHLREGHMGE